MHPIPDLDRFLTVRSDEVEHRPILIEPFIREGDLVMFTGAPGQGKSTLIADLTLALTLPEDVTGADEACGGLFKVNRDLFGRRRLVLLDAENEPAEWSELIEASAMARGLSGDDPRLEFALCGFRWRWGHDYDWDDLEALPTVLELFMRQLEALQTGVLVIDSLHKIWRKRLNDPDWVSRGLGVLKKMCRDRGITVIALVHTSRDFKDKLNNTKYLPSHTSQQEKEADCIIGMKRLIKDDALKLILVKRRAAKWNPEGTIARVGLSPTFGGYTRVHESWSFQNPRDADTPGVHLLAHQKRLLLALPTVGRFQYQDMPHARQKAPGALKPLLDQKLVEHVAGKGIKGDPKKFRLTNLGMIAQERLQSAHDKIYSDLTAEPVDQYETGQVDS